MNLKLNLLKIAPVVTTIAVGVFAPIEMVNAASGSDHTYAAKTTQQEVVKKSTTAAGSHGKSTTATGGHGHSTAVTGGHGHSTAVTGGHGHSTTATGSHGKSTANMSEMLTSPKAQQIEFFSFLSVIGLSLIVPEIFYRPKKEAQKLVIVEKNQASNEQELQQSESREHQQPIPAEIAPTRIISLSQEPEATENTETKKDLPNLKVIADSPAPYTIPNKEIGQIQTNGKTKLDNWSQPNRDAA
jgi:hypothetical protein